MTISLQSNVIKHVGSWYRHQIQRIQKKKSWLVFLRLSINAYKKVCGGDKHYWIYYVFDFYTILHRCFFFCRFVSDCILSCHQKVEGLTLSSFHWEAKFTLHLLGKSINFKKNVVLIYQIGEICKYFSKNHNFKCQHLVKVSKSSN